MSETNVFKHYDKTENQFTNSLISILELSEIVDDSFIPNFFSSCLRIKNARLLLRKSGLALKVLRGQEGGHADAQIHNDKLYFLVESKIVPRKLEKAQVTSHLASIKKKSQKLKRLILLTPDSDESSHVKQFQIIDRSTIFHLSWKTVYGFLEHYVDGREESLFVKLVSQFQSMIKEEILDQKIGIIQKIHFGPGGVNDDYLDVMERGKWGRDWFTPSYYPELDGPGRKLILYDPKEKALTAEWKIKRVEKAKRKNHPCRNILIRSSLRIFKPAIPLRQIERIEGLKKFRKGQSSHWNLTRQQYDELTKTAKAERTHRYL